MLKYFDMKQLLKTTFRPSYFQMINIIHVLWMNLTSIINYWLLIQSQFGESGQLYEYDFYSTITTMFKSCEFIFTFDFLEFDNSDKW